MRYFIDTEFIEQQGLLDLISIAIVSADGREIYAVSNEFDASRASEWVVQNVLGKLPPRETWLPRADIAQRIRAFIGDEAPEFWAYFADYDWVLFCWLFGPMIDLPQGWPMFCMDLKQSMVERGLTKADLPRMDPTREHDALEDARWLRAAHHVTMARVGVGARRRTDDARDTSVAELTHQRDTLITEIVEAAIKAGIADPSVCSAELTGWQVILLLREMAGTRAVDEAPRHAAGDPGPYPPGPNEGPPAGPNPDLYARLKVPYPSTDEARAALERFTADVHVARVKHRIPDVLISGLAFTDRPVMMSAYYGDGALAIDVAAHVLGQFRRDASAAEDARIARIAGGDSGTERSKTEK